MSSNGLPGIYYNSNSVKQILFGPTQFHCTSNTKHHEKKRFSFKQRCSLGLTQTRFWWLTGSPCGIFAFLQLIPVSRGLSCRQTYLALVRWFDVRSLQMVLPWICRSQKIYDYKSTTETWNALFTKKTHKTQVLSKRREGRKNARISPPPKKKLVSNRKNLNHKHSGSFDTNKRKLSAQAASGSSSGSGSPVTKESSVKGCRTFECSGTVKWKEETSVSCIKRLLILFGFI